MKVIKFPLLDNTIAINPDVIEMVMTFGTDKTRIFLPGGTEFVVNLPFSTVLGMLSDDE